MAQVFSPAAELVILTATATNVANTEFETQPLTAEMKTRKAQEIQSPTDFFMLFTN